MTIYIFCGILIVQNIERNKKITMVYMILADGFEEIEALEPLDILRRGGVDIQTVSIMDTTNVVGAHNIPVTADILVDDISLDDMNMVILPGGAGHELLDASNDVHAILNHAVAHNKYIAAICASPSILGKKQLLVGKRATCFPGFEKYCYDAIITGEKAVHDGFIITGKGAGAAAEFGFMLLSILKDEKTANELKATMQYV